MDQKFNKAFWDACANGDFATVCAEIKKGADINYQNGDGRTGLMRAAKRDYKDIVRVLLDNGAHNIKSQAHTVFILAAGFIRFVKFVKDHINFICRNPLAAIFDAHLSAVVDLLHMQFDIAALIDKLDGVFNQVIHHLMDHIRVAVDKQALGVLQPRDLNILFLDIIFKGDQDA